MGVEKNREFSVLQYLGEPCWVLQASVFQKSQMFGDSRQRDELTCVSTKKQLESPAGWRYKACHILCPGDTSDSDVR